MKKSIVFTLLLALAVTSGCGKKEGGEVAEKGEEVMSEDRGLAHPDNDESIVTMAKTAMECQWKGDSLERGCEGYKAWNGYSKDFREGAHDATLLNILEDSDKTARYLAAKALQNSSSKWGRVKESGERILAAAKRETDKNVSGLIGRLVGSINVAETALDGGIKELLAQSTNSELRQGIVRSVLFNNRKAGDFYDLLQKLARQDKDKEVRKAAAAAFWTGGSDRKDDTCKLWLELSADDDGDLAGHSAYHCSWWSYGGGCTGQWDTLLNTIEKRAKAGTVESTFMTSGLGWLQQQKGASIEQKDRALKVAEAVVANPANDKQVRGNALRIIGEYNPAASKTLAAQYKDDGEFFVKSAANRILEGKVKPKQRK